MNLAMYHEQILAPVLFVLLAGLLALMLLRKQSASAKQFVCSSILIGVLLAGLTPLIPQRATPPLPRQLLPVVYFAPSAGVVVQDRITPPATPHQASQNSALPSVSLIISGVSLLLLLRLALSLLAVATMRRSSRPAPPKLAAMSKYPISIVPKLASPVAIGGLRGQILLPIEAVEWPEERLRAVLVHEESHLSNGDPYWQILAELVCCLHWFNPFVWWVRSSMRNAAERAADDAVIRAGIQPSDYAESLVGFAKVLRRNHHSYAWTTFARKSGIKSRVRAILDAHIRRTPVGRAVKAFIAAGILMTTYVASAFAQHPSGTVANPQSPYEDIRSGKTVAARSSNGFVGRLADGREVEVLQISRQLANGKVVVWKPNGTPIPTSEAIPMKYHSLKTLDTHVRYVVLRYQENKNGITDPNAGCGSGGHMDHGPQMMSFCGGGTISHKDGYYTIVSYIGLPKEDAEQFPIGFGVSDTTWQDAAVVKSDDKALANVSTTEVEHPKKGDLEKEAWWTTHKAPYTMVEFDYLSKGIVGDLQVRPVFRDNSRKFEESKMYGSFGRYVGDSLRCRYYFEYRLADVIEYRIQTRSSLNCEIYDLAANPKSGY